VNKLKINTHHQSVCQTVQSWYHNIQQERFVHVKRHLNKKCINNSATVHIALVSAAKVMRCIQWSLATVHIAAPHTTAASYKLPLPPLSNRRYFRSVSRCHACVCVSVCPLTAHRISLGGEGNALYPVVSSHYYFWLTGQCFFSQSKLYNWSDGVPVTQPTKTNRN